MFNAYITHFNELELVDFMISSKNIHPPNFQQRSPCFPWELIASNLTFWTWRKAISTFADRVWCTTKISTFGQNWAASVLVRRGNGSWWLCQGAKIAPSSKSGKNWSSNVTKQHHHHLVNTFCLQILNCVCVMLCLLQCIHFSHSSPSSLWI